MSAWFDALDILSRIFFCIAVPATLLLLVQLVLLIIGLGNNGAEADAPEDADADAADVPDGGLRLFTVWGLITFFTVLGWTGYAMSQQGLARALTVPVALVLGLAAMFALALIMRAMLSLQQNGALHIQNAIGHAGQVYLTVPASRTETGKVSLLVQDRYAEFSAVTDEPMPIPSGTEVNVIGVTGQNTLLVETIREGGIR